MATNKLCDKCGAVIKSMSNVEVIMIAPAYPAEIETIELCKGCALELREWLKLKEEQDGHCADHPSCRQ